MENQQENSGMDIDELNSRIQKEICHDVLNQLSDESLMCEYKNCNSVKNQINILKGILEKHVEPEKNEIIINEYLPQLIPAGTKGVIRGNKFNKLVEHYIMSLNLDNSKYDVCFEKKCETHMTSEIPDWYILEKDTDKIIIGMNQLDLWGGGQQLNRGSKYLINNKHNNEKSKLLCVVCKDAVFKSKKNKAYNLFDVGFRNNTLCYMNNLKNIIFMYFRIKML